MEGKDDEEEEKGREGGGEARGKEAHGDMLTSTEPEAQGLLLAQDSAERADSQLTVSRAPLPLPPSHHCSNPTDAITVKKTGGKGKGGGAVSG